MNESMFSQIDLIRQDSKDVRDFVKKVFSDREFKSMSKDTDFIKYLKSIYEGTHLDEEHVKFSNRTQNGTITTGSVQTTNETIKEDQDCWDTHKVGNPKTKISSKTGKRVNNCVPKSESVVNEANLRLNKKVKSELDAYLKGTKINSPEHQHAIMLILKGALTDANFHSEAKQLPKFFPKAKQSKHVGSAMEDVIEDKGAAYSKAAKWDGHDIIDAFSFYTSMAIGGSFGKKLETLKESISESVSEGKDDFMARHGKADINLKKGYKHHNEDELTKLYDKVGKLTKDKKIKKVDVVFEDKSEIKGLIKKVGNKETKFYDVLSAMEKKYGKQKYRIWLEKSLKDFGVNPKHYDYRTNAGAEEKLYQLGK